MAEKPTDENASQPVTTNHPSAKEKMLRGSAWMTAGSVFSRILGAIYIIPWYTWLGKDSLAGNALYTKGYTLYSVFLMISIAGIPSAVAKQVAHYNAQNEYAVGQRLFKKSLLVMLAFGVIGATVMWLIAPLSFISLGEKDVIPVFRSLAVALIVIPVMSLTRGFFQGYQDMFPSALSQLIEQLVRIIYMLVTMYLIMQILHGNYQLAIIHSTLAAFVGALGGLSILIWYYWRKHAELRALALQSAGKLQVKDSKIIYDMLAQSVPFVLIGASTTLYNQLDYFTFKPTLTRFSNDSLRTINDLYAIFAGNDNKLIMIIVALASAMAATAVPLLSAAYTKKDQQGVADQIADALELFMIIMLPCSLGMAAVAKPLYIVFYQYNFTGIFVLSFSAYIALPIGLFIVLSSLLQGIYQNKRAVQYFLVGFLIKLLVQVPLTICLKAFGPLLATGIGLMVSNILMLRYFYFACHLDLNRLLGRFNQILIFSLLTFLVALVVIFIASQMLDLKFRLISFVVLVLAAGLGAFVYLYCCLKSRLADQVIGRRVAGLRKILHIK